jgi:hypothetical protein
MNTIFQLACEAENISEFLKEMKWSITKDRWEEARVGLDIVETGIQHGMKEVDKKFHFHLHQAGNKTSGLFQSNTGTHSKENERYRWLQSRVKAYEKFYGEKAK